MKIQFKKRSAKLPALAILAAVIFIGLILIVTKFPEVADWIQETLRIIFNR